jgi:hypothetical protein
MTDRPGSFLRILSLVLAGVLALAIAGAGPLFAEEAAQVPAPAEIPPEATPPQEQPPAEPPPAEKPLEKPTPAEKPSGIVEFMERTHIRLEDSILDRVIRFDNFFGSAKTGEIRQPDYLLRWRNSLRWEEEGNRFKYRTSVRASFILPRISNRLRLVVLGENEAEPVFNRLPEEPGVPGFDRTLSNTRLVNTELRYGVIRKPFVDLFVGAGVRIKIPFETFVRSRFQYTHRFGDVFLVRFAETPFWKNTDGFGETTEVELVWRLSPRTVLVWANAGTFTEESPGLEWGTDLSLLRELSPRSALTVSGGLFGHTRPSALVDTYRILARYRRNFLRPWLFYELEPEVSWPRDPVGAYTTAYAFTARLEVVFQGTAAMTKKPPGSP